MSTLAADAKKRFCWDVAGPLSSAVDASRERYGLDEDFDRRVVSYWMSGFAKAQIAALWKLLRSVYGSQADIAEALARKSPSSISHHIRSNTLTAEQLLVAYSRHPDELHEILTSGEAYEEAVVEGYIEAMFNIRNRDLSVGQHSRTENRLTREKFECLREALCGREWPAAVRQQDAGVSQAVAMKILKQIHEELDGPHEVNTMLDLVHLTKEWAGPFWLCVDSLAHHEMPGSLGGSGSLG